MNDLYRLADILNKYMKVGFFKWNGVKSTNKNFICRLSKMSGKPFYKSGAFYCIS